MLKFVFIAVLASLPFWNYAMDFNNIPGIGLLDARTGNFQQICKQFCGNRSTNGFFRELDDAFQPRIFCGLCKKKFSTTTASTTASPSSTQTSTAASTTVSPSSTQTSTGASTTVSPSSTETSTRASSTETSMTNAPVSSSTSSNAKNV